jgi:hypothetical protein
MAVVHGGLERLGIKYPGIDLSGIKLIGWGAGQWFSDYYPLLELPLEYTVCPRPENQGRVINGVQVRSPEALRAEDPSRVVIVILASHSNEVTNQVRALGDFRCAPAIGFGVDPIPLIDELQQLIRSGLMEAGSSLSQIRTAHRENGFFYQGPLFPYSELALAYQRLKYPYDFHCLVTYTVQDPVLLSQCSRWVDEVILEDDVKNPGPFNRNLMMRTARRGSQRVLERGCKYAVRVRSGNVVFGNLEKYIRRQYGAGELNKDKIGFYMGWSWKNVPFHISDAFMVARANDMVKLWGVPEDGAPIESIAVSEDSHFSEYKKVTSECYLWSSYAKSQGFSVDSLHDYYSFMKDRLLPLEPEMNTFSLKHVPIFNLEFDNSMSPDIAWWRRLSENFDAEYARGLARYESACTIRDYWRAKLG